MELAIAAVQGQPNVTDMPMDDIDPSPGALNLHIEEHAEPCRRCGRPTKEGCP